MNTREQYGTNMSTLAKHHPDKFKNANLESNNVVVDSSGTAILDSSGNPIRTGGGSDPIPFTNQNAPGGPR